MPKPASQRDRGYTNLLHHVSTNDKRQNKKLDKILEILKGFKNNDLSPELAAAINKTTKLVRKIDEMVPDAPQTKKGN